MGGLVRTATTLAVLGASAPARAQQVQIQAGGARTIVGVVTDSAGFPMDAEVYVVSLKRSATAGADGRFRFENIRPGRYEVGARRIGFFPQLKRVMVGDTGAAVTFALVPFRFSLPPVITSAARGGLGGIVGDTAYQTLAGAEVTSLASARGQTVTDSTGRFFLDLKPGRHMVRITKPGFASRLMSVTMPRDSGRQIVVQLTPALRRIAREEFNTRALRERLLTRSPVYSTFYTREDIEKLHFKDFGSLVNAGAGQPVDEGCPALIDGGPQQLPIWLLSSAEIEAMEVYVRPRARYTVGGATSTGPSSRVVPRGPEGCSRVIAWLRK